MVAVTVSSPPARNTAQRVPAAGTPVRVSAPLRAAEFSPRAQTLLLVLVLVLHAAGAFLLANMTGPRIANTAPTVLQVSWVAGAEPAAPPGPPVETIAPEVQPAPPARQRPQPRLQQRQQRQPRTSRPVRVARPAPRPRVPAPVPSPLLAMDADAPGTDNPPVAAPAAEPEPPSQSPSQPDSGSGTGTADTSRSTAPTAGRGGGADYIAPDFNANYLSNPEPAYPAASRRLREQGIVKLRVHVTETGRPNEVKLEKSSGYERLDTAATEAVRRWQFRPASRAGVAVAGWVVVPIKFNLQG
jgi:protein TonB